MENIQRFIYEPSKLLLSSNNSDKKWVRMLLPIIKRIFYRIEREHIAPARGTNPSASEMT